MTKAAEKYTVFLTAGAEQDLESLYDYISESDCPEKAEYVLNQLEASFDSLEQFPERGGYPKELLALGIKEFRQISFKPYQLIYRVDGRRVIVYVIVDGRRDLQSLLARRLLTAIS